MIQTFKQRSALLQAAERGLDRAEARRGWAVVIVCLVAIVVLGVFA